MIMHSIRTIFILIFVLFNIVIMYKYLFIEARDLLKNILELESKKKKLFIYYPNFILVKLLKVTTSSPPLVTLFTF